MLVSVFTDSSVNIINKHETKECYLINGKKTNLGSCSGYCGCKEHPGYLTSKIMTNHKCYEKECLWLYKILKNNKTYDDDLDLNQILEANRKQYLDICNNLRKEYDGIKFTDVIKNGKLAWSFKFTTICSVDLVEISNLLGQVFKGNIELVDCKYDFDKAVRIIYG